MKLKSILLAATLAAFAASATTIFAAEEHPADAPAVKADAAKTDTGEAKKPVKKVKRHNHMEEKTGMPVAEPAPDMHKAIPKNRHDHTKEKR